MEGKDPSHSHNPSHSHTPFSLIKHNYNKLKKKDKYVKLMRTLTGCACLWRTLKTGEVRAALAGSVFQKILVGLVVLFLCLHFIQEHS